MAANVDHKVLGYLGRALSLELSAVQNYTTQARLAETWGLTEAAKRFRQEAIEELNHVERIVARLIALGAAPSASVLRPAGVGSSLRALLEHDHAFENDLIRLYSDATAYAARTGDTESRLFFEGILREEREHADEFRKWMSAIEAESPT